MTRTSVHRPTSTTTRLRTLCAAASASLVGALLAITLGSASAMPGRGDPPRAPAPTVHTRGHYVAHGCFITPHNLNEAAAEALPICYTYVP
jgi:hypothetical protein